MMYATAGASRRRPFAAAAFLALAAFGLQPMAARAQSSADLAQQSMRVDRVEDQMRQLTGQIEQLTYQIQQLQSQIQRMQQDNEFRLQELEGGRPQKRSEAPRPPADVPDEETASVYSTGPADSPADLSTGFSIDAGDPIGNQVQVLGNVPGTDAPLPSDGETFSGPLDLSAIARGDEGYQPPVAADPGLPGVASVDRALPPANVAAPTAPSAGGTEVAAVIQPEDPRAAYDLAYNYLVDGRYDLAALGFRQFIEDHPRSTLVGNAHFWLGESHFARSEFREAANSFLTTYRDFPNNPKAPESLLKLGLSLEGLGERDAACATYGELEKKFPSAPGNLLSRVSQQKSAAGC